VSEWHSIQQFEYRWQPSKDLSMIAGSVPAAEIQPWRDRISLWVRHRAVDAPTESVRYEIFADDGMAALAWRQRTLQALKPGDGTEGRPEISRVLMGPADLLTPEAAMVICHTGLPEAIGPRPGKIAVGGSLPPVNPEVLTGLIRSQTCTLDRLALGEPGLHRVIAAALADCDSALSVQLPQRVIEKPPQEGAQGPLLWGLRRAVWPLLGHDSGRRGWSFSTYEPPLGDVDTGALADIVFRTQQAVQSALNTRKEIVVRPRDLAGRPATLLYQDVAKLLVTAYEHLGGEKIGQHLDAVRGGYGSVSKRIEGVQATLHAALPASALSVQGRQSARTAHQAPRQTREALPSEGPAPADDEAAAFLRIDLLENEALPGGNIPAATAAGAELVTQQPPPRPSAAPQPLTAHPPGALPPETSPPPDTRQPAANEPPHTAWPDTPQHTAPAPPDMPLPDLPPSDTPPSWAPNSPGPALGAPDRASEEAPPLRTGPGHSQAAGRRYTLVDLLNQLRAGPGDREAESAVQLLRSGRFTSYPGERAEARHLMAQHKWYLPVLEHYDRADPGSLLQTILSYAVIPDLGKSEVTEQLANWVEEREAQPSVIKALNAAAQDRAGAPERMGQALERPLGRRWMAEHGIHPGPRTSTDPISGPRSRGTHAIGGTHSRWAVLEGKLPGDPVTLLALFSIVLVVLLILSLTR
jgi:hypothetical protein